jgi:hypothetical protein
MRVGFSLLGLSMLLQYCLLIKGIFQNFMVNKHSFMFLLRRETNGENAFTRKGRQENYCPFNQVSVDRNRSNWAVGMLPVKFAMFFYPLLRASYRKNVLLAHSCYYI